MAVATADQIYSHEYFKYLQNRSKIRRFIRKAYLNDIQHYCIGKTIDLGCGIGELLKILPKGSIGFEVNKVAVDFCKSKGLQVELYDPENDNYQFKMIKEGEYQSFTMNHVLEHLENSSIIIENIFESCNRLDISRIVFTVPGMKGYKSDKTHVTYIDLNYLNDKGILKNKYYKLIHYKYFPFNWKLISRYFVHNELRLVFEKRK